MLVFELFWNNLDMEWQGNPPLSLTKTKWVIICDFISYFMCNVGQHISKNEHGNPSIILFFTSENTSAVFQANRITYIFYVWATLT